MDGGTGTMDRWRSSAAAAALAALAALTIGCGGTRDAAAQDASGEPAAPHTNEERATSAATSPNGDDHPGEIEHVDEAAGTSRRVPADEVPQTVGWVAVDDGWAPVVRVVMRKGGGRTEILKFGPDGALLETTISVPRPTAPAAPTPTPTPQPTE